MSLYIPFLQSLSLDILIASSKLQVALADDINRCQFSWLIYFGI